LLWALVVWGSFYNLANFPSIWWDEAIFSETAANLVQHGRYAFTVQSPNQLNDLDFRISVGPAIILPVALAYKLLGVGVVPGRLVAGAYLVLLFLALYLGTRRLWGPAAALGAVALALLGTDVLSWGRSVLGDVPALGLFLLGLWFLGRGLDTPARGALFAGGIFLGLAFDAKEFYGLAFLPPLFLLMRQWWRDKVHLFKSLLAFSLGVCLPLLAYLLLKWVILGNLEAAVLHFLQQKKLLCHEFFTPLTIGRIYPESLLILLRHPLFWLGALGAYGVWKKGASWGEKLWLINFGLWSLVYLTAVWWHRFALPALFLASPLAALFLGRAAVRLSAWLPRPPRWLAPGLVAAVLIMFYPFSGAGYLKEIYTHTLDTPYRLVNYLKTHVPRSCLIETPEYELVFLTDDYPIHLMPAFYFHESTPERIVLLNPRKKPYDFNRVGADVLVVGAFGKSVFRQIYPPERIAGKWRRLAQVGDYDIYVSRQGRAKMRKMRAAPVVPVRLDLAKKQKYSGFHAPPLILRTITEIRRHYRQLGAGDAILGLFPWRPGEEAKLLDLVSRGVAFFPAALAQMLVRSKVAQAEVLGEFMVPGTFAAYSLPDLARRLGQPQFPGDGQVVTKRDQAHLGLGVSLWSSLEVLYSLGGLQGLPFPLVVQPFLAGARDFRAVVLGDYAEAYERLNPGSFRKNLFQGGSSRPLEVTPEILAFCRQVMARGQFPYAILDLLVSEAGEVYLAEISLKGGLTGARLGQAEFRERVKGLEDFYVRQWESF
jgi:ribosomal protein S6--L-glutamate ligase